MVADCTKLVIKAGSWGGSPLDHVMLCNLTASRMYIPRLMCCKYIATMFMLLIDVYWDDMSF